MHPFAKLTDVEALWRPMLPSERDRAEQLLIVVSDSIREEGKKVGKNVDELATVDTYASVLRSVVVDVVARTLMTSTDAEPMTQVTQSAGGYSVSGTYLVPGGGLFIKRSELARLGLRRQKIGGIELYGGID